MRVLSKEKEGMVLIPENLNDLWYLYKRVDNNALEKLDLRTKSAIKAGDLIKGKKVPQLISIKVKKKKWEVDKFRVTGIIVSESDKHKHHSFEIELNKKIKVLEKLENLPGEDRYEVLICVVDKDVAEFKVYSKGFMKEVSKIYSKGRENEFYKEVALVINKEKRSVLLAGPGKTKDLIEKFLEKEVVKDNVYTTGDKAFKELLGRGSILQVLEKIREEKEKERVNKFFLELKKNPEKVCYGETIKENLDKVKEVLVVSSLVEKHYELLEKLEEQGTQINIVNDEKDYCDEIKKFEIIGVCWW